MVFSLDCQATLGHRRDEASEGSVIET